MLLQYLPAVQNVKDMLSVYLLAHANADALYSPRDVALRSSRKKGREDRPYKMLTVIVLDGGVIRR